MYAKMHVKIIRSKIGHVFLLGLSNILFGILIQIIEAIKLGLAIRHVLTFLYQTYRTNISNPASTLAVRYKENIKLPK